MHHNHIRASWWFCHIPRFLLLTDSCHSAADSSRPWMSLTCSYCVSLLCRRLHVLLISGWVYSWSATIGPLARHTSVKGQSLTLGCVRQAVLIWTCARRAAGRDFIRLPCVAKENLGVVQDSYGGSSPVFLFTKSSITLYCTHECLCWSQPLIWMAEYIVFRHKLIIIIIIIIIIINCKWVVTRWQWLFYM